jgi:hypothetical protein
MALIFYFYIFHTHVILNSVIPKRSSTGGEDSVDAQGVFFFCILALVESTSKDLGQNVLSVRQMKIQM